jgi:thymidylate synthase
VLEKLGTDLAVPIGRIFWHAGSFHVYERHFHLIECYAKTGDLYVAKKDWEKIRSDI